MKKRHTFHHNSYHQILVLDPQRLVLVTEKRFVDEYFSSSFSSTKLTMIYTDIYIYTVGTESIQTPFNFSLFVILQPFAKII